MDSKNSKIVTFGDSWTDNCNTDSWPNKLAHLLNRELIQLGQRGSCNQTILSRILEQTYNPADIVVVMWSNPWRIFNPYEVRGINVASRDIELSTQDSTEAEYIKAFGRFYLGRKDNKGEYAIARQSLQQALLVQEFFKNKNILCIQCYNYIDMTKDFTDLPELNLIDKNKFYGLGLQTISNLLGGGDIQGSGLQLEQGKEANAKYWSDKDCWTHPGPLGHKLIAETLKKCLDNSDDSIYN